MTTLYCIYYKDPFEDYDGYFTKKLADETIFKDIEQAKIGILKLRLKTQRQAKISNLANDDLKIWDDADWAERSKTWVPGQEDTTNYVERKEEYFKSRYEYYSSITPEYVTLDKSCETYDVFKIGELTLEDE
jgi:hypothetical protein